ncbi:MAG: patatin-like phospholipase family protein [Pyrinomonadaceae bacterium]
MNDINFRPKIGLALGGGAARAAAHIGVLKVLEEHKIPIDCIAGTSAGSIVGGAYAAGLSAAKLEKLVNNLRWRDAGRMTFSRRGLQSIERLGAYITKNFPCARFEDLLLPFAAVATDIESGEEVVLRDAGDLGLAIRASCALPGIYVPVKDEQGRHLVDGGLVSVVPVSAVRSLGADVVIAVDVNAEGAKFLGAPKTMLGILLQAAVITMHTGTKYQLMDADVVLRPRIGHIRWDEVKRGGEMITAGEDAAREHIEEIKEIIALKTQTEFAAVVS